MGIVLRDYQHLRDYISGIRAHQNIPIIWTNGCFDVFHVGHAWSLAQAKAAAPDGKLIVGLNSDASVRRIKGVRRPIVPQSDRASLLCYLRSVDAVIIFDDDTPYRMIEVAQPDIIVKGEDWRDKVVIGQGIVEARGGFVHLVPLQQGRTCATSGIVEKILEAYSR